MGTQIQRKSVFLSTYIIHPGHGAPVSVGSLSGGGGGKERERERARELRTFCLGFGRVLCIGGWCEEEEKHERVRRKK
jgi:hypothetical protein